MRLSGSVMTLSGMQQVLDELRRRQGLVKDDPMKLILEEAAAPIKEDAVRRAAAHHRTGRLEEKITILPAKRNKGRVYVKIGVPRFAGVGYAIPLEWGHINRDGSITAPAPFMQPAYESQKETAYLRIRQGLEEQIIKAGGSG